MQPLNLARPEVVVTNKRQNPLELALAQFIGNAVGGIGSRVGDSVATRIFGPSADQKMMERRMALEELLGQSTIEDRTGNRELRAQEGRDTAEYRAGTLNIAQQELDAKAQQNGFQNWLEYEKFLEAQKSGEQGRNLTAAQTAALQNQTAEAKQTLAERLRSLGLGNDLTERQIQGMTVEQLIKANDLLKQTMDSTDTTGLTRPQQNQVRDAAAATLPESLRRPPSVAAESEVERALMENFGGEITSAPKRPWTLIGTRPERPEGWPEWVDQVPFGYLTYPGQQAGAGPTWLDSARSVTAEHGKFPLERLVGANDPNRSILRNSQPRPTLPLVGTNQAGQNEVNNLTAEQLLLLELEALRAGAQR